MSSSMEPPQAVKDILHWEQLRETSLGKGLTDNWVNIAMMLFFVVMAGGRYLVNVRTASKVKHDARFLPAPDFPTITEQLDFDYAKTEPLQLRPFRPKYYLTMADATALENLNPDELILMDKNHKDRIAYRRRIMAEHPKETLSVTDDPRIGAAVREYYTWITGTYLPLRYPSMFKLHKTTYEVGEHFLLQNLLTGEMWPSFPLEPRTTQNDTLLSIMGKTLDEDILFLLPEKNVPEGQDPKYVLHAYIVCCPSGFNPAEKIGKRLADIHSPVPGYSAKLESSMDRYFAKLEVGKYVKRVNWSVTTDAELFSAGGGTVHAHEGDKVEQLQDINVDTTFLRCERQTLHRLPKSKAIIFAFKTHLYPIKQIKAEGLGPQLAEAIDGLRDGNVPGMHFYKRGAVWGEAVKRYLREGRDVVDTGEKTQADNVRRRKG